jgi:hypothetical protein
MEYKIETDLNNETHLVYYKNDDGTIIKTGTFDECKNSLIALIKSRHRVTHVTYSHNKVIDHSQENKEISCKDFCNF